MSLDLSGCFLDESDDEEDIFYDAEEEFQDEEETLRDALGKHVRKICFLLLCSSFFDCLK